MALRFPLISDEKYEATVTFSAVQSSMSSGGGNTLTTSNKITAGDSGALSRGGSGGSKEITKAVIPESTYCKAQVTKPFPTPNNRSPAKAKFLNCFQVISMGEKKLEINSKTLPATKKRIPENIKRGITFTPQALPK